MYSIRFCEGTCLSAWSLWPKNHPSRCQSRKHIVGWGLWSSRWWLRVGQTDGLQRHTRNHCCPWNNRPHRSWVSLHRKIFWENRCFRVRSHASWAHHRAESIWSCSSRQWWRRYATRLGKHFLRPTNFFSLELVISAAAITVVIQVKGLLKEKKLETLVDGDLAGNYIDVEVEQLIQVALLCTQSSPMERPKMSDVVRMLEGDGLAERWEEWQKEEMFRQDFHPIRHPNTDWLIDSISNIKADELSGPR